MPTIKIITRLNEGIDPSLKNLFPKNDSKLKIKRLHSISEVVAAYKKNNPKTDDFNDET
jgi:hypothetical protein